MGLSSVQTLYILSHIYYIYRDKLIYYNYDIKKGGDIMPITEKEYNGYLFDQLSILERIEAVTTDETALK